MSTNNNGQGPGQVTPENDNGRNPLEQVAPVKTLSNYATNVIAYLADIATDKAFPRYPVLALLLLSTALILGACYE
jgi:hypothetical protein